MAKTVLITGGYRLTAKPLPNAIGSVVIPLCFSGFMVVQFSKEKASVYAEHLEGELKKPGALL